MYWNCKSFALPTKANLRLEAGGSKVRQTLQIPGCREHVLATAVPTWKNTEMLNFPWCQSYFWIKDCHKDIATDPNSRCSSSEGNNFELVLKFVNSISNMKIIKIHWEL